MNMLMATFEHGELQPSRTDAFFRYHDQELTQVDESGHVEGPTGHFTLRKVRRSDIGAYASEYGDPWVTEARNFATGWYIDVRGEDGTVWAFKYADEAAAREDYDEAERLYVEWSADEQTVEETEFFSTYAQNYAEPEVVWLERIITDTGAPYSPNVIARAILRAGYVRSGATK